MLNPYQQAAVDCDADRVCVSAGPGTGKTHVLIERVRRALRKGEAPTVLTFTRAAAKEVRSRFKDADRRALHYCGTIHGYATTILRANPWALPSSITNLDRPWSIAPPASVEIQSRMQTEVGKTLSLHDSNLLTHDEVLSGAIRVAQMAASKNLLQICEGLGRGLTLVDEAQDLTAAEWRFIRLLQTRRFVVGDMAQAIFEWRGGRPIEFAAEAIDAARNRGAFDLPLTYRCQPHLADVANRIPARGRVELEAFRPPGQGIALVRTPEVCLGHALRTGRIAIIARTTEAVRQATSYVRSCGEEVYAPALEADPWGTEGGRIVLAALRVLADQTDNLHLAFLLRASGWGCGRLMTAEAQRLRIRCTLYDWARHYAYADPVVAQTRDVVNNDHGRYDLVSGLQTVLGAVAADRQRKWVPAAEDALHIISEWWRQSLPDERSPADFLEWLGSPNVSVDALLRRTTAPTSAAITATTIHGAKGQEWDTVILWGCEEGILPARGDLADDRLEEARRLFYVACTRAKDNLLLAVRNDATPSRLLAEAGL